MQYMEIPVQKVFPNPDQPRKTFNEAKLHELAGSIKAQGLAQPILVRRTPDGFQIVAGERRWRAHKIAGMIQIRANVVEVDDRKRDMQALLENNQREDVGPYEEATAYRRAMEVHGLTVEELAKDLGIRQPWRVKERLDLLNLQPDYVSLLEARQITPTQAWHLSQLDGHDQRKLFDQIKRGNCPDDAALKRVYAVIKEGAAQASAFDLIDAPAATKEQVRLASAFEGRVERVADMLRAGIKDNEISAVKAVDPTKAQTLADRLKVMQTDLKRLELALREAAVQEVML